MPQAQTHSHNRWTTPETLASKLAALGATLGDVFYDRTPESADRQRRAPKRQASGIASMGRLNPGEPPSCGTQKTPATSSARNAEPRASESNAPAARR